MSFILSILWMCSRIVCTGVAEKVLERVGSVSLVHINIMKIPPLILITKLSTQFVNIGMRIHS